jgi:two-component system LytT family response regulator
MPLKTILVDDSLISLKTLEFILKENFSEIEIVGTFENVAEASLFIHTNAVDLLLLDINMPVKDGFDLLKEFPDRNFQTIFVTSYEEYALKAIKAGVTDYLIKPIKLPEIQEAIKKAIQIHNERYQYKPHGKISLSFIGGKAIFDPEEVIYIQGVNNLTKVFLTNQRRFMISKTLKYFADLLDDRFFRIHKSYLVNLDFVSEISYDETAQVTLRNGVTLPVSRRSVKLLKDAINKRSIH